MPKTLDWVLLEETYDPVQPKPDGFTYRARVPGGWLVSVWAGTMEKHGMGGGLTFLPDPDDKWDSLVDRRPYKQP